MLILNEQKYAEDLYRDKNQEIKSVIVKIGYVTRYQLHVLNYSDEDNYKYTVKWMHKHHNNFDESCYSNLISDAIKRAHKHPFYNIGSIKITKTELDIICSLDNLRQEKVLFALLCMAKHQSISNGFINGLVRYSLPDLCKTARISVPADDREYILYDIVQKGFLGYPKKNNSQCLIVNFIDEDSDVVLNIDEIDVQELAYVYLQWKNNGGYQRCKNCGRLMRKNKNRKYCVECAQYQPVGDKLVTCMDCGKKFSVDAKNNQTFMCDDCYVLYRRKQKTETMRKLRTKE